MKLNAAAEKNLKKVVTGLKLWQGLDGVRSAQEIVDETVWYCEPPEYDKIQRQRVLKDPRWTSDNIAELVNEFLVSLIEAQQPHRKAKNQS